MRHSDIVADYGPVKRMNDKAEKLKEQLGRGVSKGRLLLDTRNVPDRHESKGVDSPTPILRSQASEERHAASHEVGSSTSDVLGGGLASLNGPGRRLVSNRLSRQSLSSNEGDGESLLQLGMHADPLAHSSSASLLRQSAAGISHSSMMGAPSSPLRGNNRSRSSSPTKLNHHAQSLQSAEQSFALQHKVSLLEEEVERWKDRVKDLTEEAERRQQSYIRREAIMTEKANQLQEQLDLARGVGGRGGAEGSDGVPAGLRLKDPATMIKDLHGQVISGIEELLKKQAVALKHEEASSIRQFKDKLAEVESQVASERASSSHVARDWINKTAAMRSELENTQSMTMQLDQQYKLAKEECVRLKAAYKCQEDDRQYLVKQIVALKQDNKRLTAEITAMAKDLQEISQDRDDAISMSLLNASLPPAELQDPSSSISSNAAGGVNTDSVKLQRCEDIIKSLQKLLDAERKRTKQARAAHTSVLHQRTELQSVLRQCLDEIRVKRDGALQVTSAANTAHGGALNRPRPASARTPPSPTSSISGLAQGGFLSSSTRRPSSAALRTARRPFSAAAGMPASVVSSEQHQDEEDGEMIMVLTKGEREALVEELVRREKLLQELFSKAFPVSHPLNPGDTASMDRLVALQDQEEREIVAAARRQQQLAQPTSLRSSLAAAAGPQGGVGLQGGAISNRPVMTSVPSSVPSSVIELLGKRLGSSSQPLRQAADASGSNVPGTGADASATAGASGWSANTDAKMVEFLSGGKGGSRPASALPTGALSSWGRPLSASKR